MRSIQATYRGINEMRRATDGVRTTVGAIPGVGADAGVREYRRTQRTPAGNQLTTAHRQVRDGVPGLSPRRHIDSVSGIATERARSIVWEQIVVTGVVEEIPRPGCGTNIRRCPCAAV